MATITINSIPYEAAESLTVLDVARRERIDIPTLCHSEALGPYGACRLCMVEAEGPMLRKSLVASCTLQVADGLVVSTESPIVRQARTVLFELLIGRSESQQLREMAARYGVSSSRFAAPETDVCVRCGLCIRVCRDKIGVSAISFAGRGQKRRVTAEFGQISRTCIGCGSCTNLCPTGAIRLKDEGGIRTIFLKDNVTGRFVLVNCSSCGTPFATKRILEYVSARQEGQPTSSKPLDMCPECARIHSAAAIACNEPF